MTWKEERMKYEVIVDYKKFLFDDRIEAMDFAEQAYMHSSKPVEVEVKFKEEA